MRTVRRILTREGKGPFCSPQSNRMNQNLLLRLRTVSTLLLVLLKRAREERGSVELGTRYQFFRTKYRSYN
jgi:hypothetical protein